MNFDLYDFNGKAVIFIGRGREGISFEKFIKANAAITSFLFIDQQDDPNYLASIEKLDFTKTIIVKTAGCPGRLVPAPYTTPTKVFFDCVRQIGSTVVGVTGTKGKTTTTALLGEMLKTTGKDIRVCGNIGNPMIDELDRATNETIFVVELSSHQLTELEVSPNIGIVTNLFNDHTDYHGSLEAYWEAKRNIMRYMDSKNTFIYNPEFDVINSWLGQSGCKSIAISPDEDVDMSKTRLLGSHNKLNAIMARHAAMLLGVDSLTCQKVIDDFEPIKHRLQKVAVKSGVTYVDDAIGSNPEATIAGITTLIREVGPVGCLFLGGKDRNYEYWPLMQLISRLQIPFVVLFPETGAKIKALRPASYDVTFFETDNMKAAVAWAYAHTPKDSICLLSTAAPSYSLWKDFEEKGDLFQEAVLSLPDQAEAAA